MTGRSRFRPLPEDWADNELMSLGEAVAVFFPRGPLKITSLRTAIKHGQLIAERIAGKIFVTPAGLREMRERSKAPKTDEASLAAEKEQMRRGRAALDAALAKNAARRKRLGRSS